MQIHLYISLFFIPMALIYSITGSLYIFDIRQNVGAEISGIKVFQEIPKGEERIIMLATLETNGLKIPEKTEICLARNSIIMGTLKH